MSFAKIISVSVMFFLLTGPVEAALNLSANPADGGNTLRLGRVDDALEVTKAVKLRVSSNDGKQYQVFQRLEDSLTNERQNILDSQAINSYTLSGSNGSGTLYSQQNEPLHLNDQLLYTSSPDGQSDTLTVVYSVNPDRVKASGNYMGRIAYIVRSLGGGQDQVFINIYLEVSGQLKVEVSGSTVRDRVRLKSSLHGTTKNDAVVVRFDGHAAGEIKVSVEIENFPKNELGEELEPEALMLSTSGGRGEGSGVTPLGHKPILLYKSRENSDEFEIDWALNASQAKAGVYRGTIHIMVETSESVQTFQLDLDITIEPVFDVKVNLPPGGIRFSRVLPTEPPDIQQIEVEVNTNLGKPYMVIHSMAMPLTNAQGNEIKSENFTMKMEPIGDASGRVAAGDFVPVKTGEMPVFFSDRRGSPAKFKVFYRLKSYPGIVPGDYAAPIVFSLGEM